MEIGIISIVVIIIIAIIPYFRRKYYLRPELTIETIISGDGSRPLGLSIKNKVNEKGILDGDSAIYIFELTWRFKIRITNNSDLTAFYPELEFNPNGPRFQKLDNLNSLQPIKPADSIELNAEYKKIEEATGEERTVVNRNSLPDEFSYLGILLEYQNSKKSKFYTLYDYDSGNGKNSFLRRKPKEYKTS